MNAVLTLALPVVGRRPALERVCLAADIGIVQAVWREIAQHPGRDADVVRAFIDTGDIVV